MQGTKWKCCKEVQLQPYSAKTKQISNLPLLSSNQSQCQSPNCFSAYEQIQLLSIAFCIPNLIYRRIVLFRWAFGFNYRFSSWQQEGIERKCHVRDDYVGRASLNCYARNFEWMMNVWKLTIYVLLSHFKKYLFWRICLDAMSTLRSSEL